MKTAADGEISDRRFPRPYLIAAVLLLLFTCWRSVGFHQGDEHFQILEFAAYKAGAVAEDQLAWEFAERMRPATQPALAYVVYRAFGLFGPPNPYHVAFFLRLLSAAAFLGVAVWTYRRFATRFAAPTLLRWFALALLFNWASVYSGVRFSGENWSGLAVAAGLLLYPLAPATDARRFTPGRDGGAAAVFGAGLLFGLAFLLRYQTAILVVGFGAWLLFVARERWPRLALVVAGGLAALAVGTLLDRWLYGEWVIAPWHYVRSNLVEGKAATFGTAPWWYYVEKTFERGVPPLSLLYLAAPLWFGWRFRRDPLVWMWVPFLAVHLYLSRKDLRFLFPLLPFLPVMMLALTQVLWKSVKSRGRGRVWLRRVVVILAVVNGVALASVALRPVIAEVAVSQYVWDHYTEPVTLLADGRHVYTYANLTMWFYQRPGRVIIHRTEDRAAWPPCTTAVCLYSERTRSPDPPPGARLVYSNRPAWLLTTPLGRLLARERWWYIYELPPGAAPAE